MTDPMSQWTPPPPPRGAAATSIKAGRVWAGIGMALGGHALTLLIPLVISLLIAPASRYPADGDRAGYFLLGAFIMQAILFVAALVIGIVLIAKKEQGIGVGIIIGWAVGLIISPVVGFGMCVALLGGALG